MTYSKYIKNLTACLIIHGSVLQGFQELNKLQLAETFNAESLVYDSHISNKC